jgi:hypothetical protein
MFEKYGVRAFFIYARWQLRLILSNLGSEPIQGAYSGLRRQSHPPFTSPTFWDDLIFSNLFHLKTIHSFYKLGGVKA